MNIIKDLTFTSVEGKPEGIITSGTTVNVGPGSFLRHVQLSNMGVMIRRKDEIVFFPMEELMKVAESVNPNLVVPKPKEPVNPANQ